MPLRRQGREIPEDPSKEYWCSKCEQPAGTVQNCTVCGVETIPLITDAEEKPFIDKWETRMQGGKH